MANSGHLCALAKGFISGHSCRFLKDSRGPGFDRLLGFRMMFDPFGVGFLFVCFLFCFLSQYEIETSNSISANKNFVPSIFKDFVFLSIFCLFGYFLVYFSCCFCFFICFVYYRHSHVGVSGSSILFHWFICICLFHMSAPCWFHYCSCALSFEIM